MKTPIEYKFIEKLRIRPSMYVGDNGITAFWHFLNGCGFALDEVGFDEKRGLFPLGLDRMTEYTAFLYNRDDSACWRTHILEHCGGDEKKALQEFFGVFDKFKEIRAERSWRAVLSEDNIAYNNDMKHGYSICADQKQPIYNEPLCAYIIKISEISAYMFAVETAAELRAERRFYTSFERAASSRSFPEGAEVYFGKINNWTPIPDINQFIADKPVRC